MQPNFALPEDEAAAVEVLRGTRRPHLHDDLRGAADHRARRFQGASTIERPVAECSDEEVDDSGSSKLAESAGTFTPGRARRQKGDRLTIAYVGKIDGEPFEGGTDDNAIVASAPASSSPASRSSSSASNAGEKKTITVTFPEDYPARASRRQGRDLRRHGQGSRRAGRARARRRACRSGSASSRSTSCARRSRKQIESRVRPRHPPEGEAPASRPARHDAHLRAAAERWSSQEFENIWRQVVARASSSTARPSRAEGTTEEEAREEYRKIAERRVRLGLVLSEIGETDEDRGDRGGAAARALPQARQFPGQEQQALRVLPQQPGRACRRLRAPIFEEKVVDYLLELAKVTDKTVSQGRASRRARRSPTITSTIIITTTTITKATTTIITTTSTGRNSKTGRPGIDPAGDIASSGTVLAFEGGSQALSPTSGCARLRFAWWKA